MYWWKGSIVDNLCCMHRIFSYWRCPSLLCAFGRAVLTPPHCAWGFLAFKGRVLTTVPSSLSCCGNVSYGKQKKWKGPRYMVPFSPINSSFQALGASYIKFWALVWPKEQSRRETEWHLLQHTASVSSVFCNFCSPSFLHLFSLPQPNKCCLYSQLSLD